MGDSATSTSLNADFRQTTDTDASGTSSWNGGDGFDPIGDSTKEFTGTFDGSGFEITGLFVNRSRSRSDGTGLFGRTGPGAVIERVGLEGASVSNANDRVGALVGSNDGTVRESYATASVSGGDGVGGLVGLNFGGTVTESYWDKDTTGQTTSAGGTGLMTSEMKGDVAKTNMTGFDFTNTCDVLTGDRG